MFGGCLLNGYQGAMPALAPFANLTWFGWTTNHLPLAGAFDWASLIPVALAVVVLLAIGVEAFVRRDIGATSAVPTPSLPRALRRPERPRRPRLRRSACRPRIAWGLGLGIFGLRHGGVQHGRSPSLVRTSPEFARMLQQVFPNADILSVGGFLQLLFVQFGLILAGLAAATLVGHVGVRRDVRPPRDAPRDAARAGALGPGRRSRDPRSDRRRSR